MFKLAKIKHVETSEGVHVGGEVHWFGGCVGTFACRPMHAAVAHFYTGVMRQVFADSGLDFDAMLSDAEESMLAGAK